MSICLSVCLSVVGDEQKGEELPALPGHKPQDAFEASSPPVQTDDGHCPTPWLFYYHLCLADMPLSPGVLKDPFPCSPPQWFHSGASA